MWVLYNFKLAYANDNTFTMRVNTNWTLMEFDNKVNGFARMVFPGINIDDRFHMTESRNHRNYSETRSAEENDPIVTEENYNTYIHERYQNCLETLSFYIYFNDTCNSLRMTRNNGGPDTLEMAEMDCEYYYNIAMDEFQDTNRQLRRNTTSGLHNTPVVQRQVSQLSVPVSLDDMIAEYNQVSSFDVSDFINNEGYTGNMYMDDQYNIATTVAEFVLNDDYQDRRETDPEYYPRNLNNEWNGINVVPDYNRGETDPEYYPYPRNINNELNDLNVINVIPNYQNIPPLQTHECCICFNDFECLTLNGCNHQVCTTCYRGVFNRIGGIVDTRCPMCRNYNAFSREIYESLDLYD